MKINLRDSVMYSILIFVFDVFYLVWTKDFVTAPLEYLICYAFVGIIGAYTNFLIFKRWHDFFSLINRDIKKGGARR